NEGTVDLQFATELQVTGTGTVSSSGTLNVSGLLTMAGNFNNSGTTTVSSFGEIQVLGSAGDVNTGTITLASPPGPFVQPAVYTTNGSFTNAAGGNVTLSGADDTFSAASFANG